ncbi:hypothetical protein, partial [Parafrankia soli]|uniref:hypothetical protein n=1 Tax=Parafrankia soli TaxID=2599596 RepID=UPI0012FF866E
TGYDVPKNTLDPRYAACADHHVACDCREAEFSELRAELLDELRLEREAHAEDVAELQAELREYRQVIESLWRTAPHEVTRRARIAWTVAQHGMYPHRQEEAVGPDARQKGLLRIANDKNLTLEKVRELAHTALGFEDGEAGAPRVGILEEIDGEPPF